MSDKKVSQLNAATSLENTDLLLISQDNGDTTFTSKKISGAVFRTQLYQGITTTDSTYTCDNLYNVIFCNATSNDITVVLPDCTTFTDTETRNYIIKKTDSSSHTVTVTSVNPTVQKIDGETSQILLNQYDCITLVSNGTVWYIT